MLVTEPDGGSGSARLSPHGPGRFPDRARLWVVVGLLTVVLGGELGVRAIDHRLPEPQRWSTPETQFKVGQMNVVGAVELVGVGSSVVDVAFDPTAVGREAYNAALGAGTMGMVSAFTRDVVIPALDPETVVVGVNPRELNANAPGLADIERRFFDAPAARETFGHESLLDTVDRLAGEISYLVRYRSVLRDPDNLIDPKPPWGGAITGSSGMYRGMLDAEYNGGPEAIRRLRNGPLHDFELGERQRAELHALLEELRTDGRRVLLVTAPVTDDLVAVYPGGRADHDRFVLAMETLAREVGVEFLATGIWDESLMADPLHTNGAGARRFTEMVAAALWA